MEPQSQNPIWTIGHSTMSIGNFMQLLDQHGIELVVDVRSAPYSRFASQFNKLDIEAVLRSRNLDYRYEGERLGGRPSDPSCYRSGIVPNQAEREDFLKLVDYEAVKQKNWFRQALAEVIELSATHLLALMCSEENPLDCHRHRMIASALHERGIEVQHIRKDGSVKQASFPIEQTALQAVLF